MLSALGYWGLSKSLQVSAQPGLPDQITNPDSAENPANDASDSTVTPSTDMPSANVDPKLIDANLRFGFKLFSQLVQQSNNENLLISPFSVATALSMVYNGAAGETQQAMATALELQGMDLDTLNQANAALAASLENADPQVKLAIANSLWGRQGFAFQPDFLQRNQQFYQAEIASLDFNSAEAPTRINNWVSQNTNNKITKIIDQINADQILFLINAVYFKGNWTTQFNPELTTERPFYPLNGTQKQHPMMTQQGNYAYYETDQFQAVSLPYGNRRLSMYIFLPKSQSSLAAFQNTLTPDNWNTWMQQFSRREGAIQLPKFKFEYESDLNAALAAMGMGIAFSSGEADFSGIGPNSPSIDEVKHKTFIEVNEEGTEAAAVTSIGVRATSINLDEPFQMVVDRPFFCAIRDQQTGTILFMGSVINPEV